MSNFSATQIIILGGGGDLTENRLFPGLYSLYIKDMLPEVFDIIGLARTPRTNEEYREFVKKTLANHKTPAKNRNRNLEDFCNRISYITGSAEDRDTYDTLKKTLDAFDDKVHKTCNRLFYLAVPPNLYQKIFADLKESGVAEETKNRQTYILIEKPFGENLETAETLNMQLNELYTEDEIFRIDHYLAKEAVQNILSFRFANEFLQVPWNKDSIKSVTITMTETIDVGDRVNFYEGVGALRDVGQNHLLHLVALTAMREPSEFSALAIRGACAEALKALKPIQAEQLESSVLRGQYIEYLETDGVPVDSQTETYFELKVELDMPEWEGVPFYIRAGKALDKAEVAVTVEFKEDPSGMFGATEGNQSIDNTIKLNISPSQTTSVTLNSKAPGLGFQLKPLTLSITAEDTTDTIKNSHEKVLYDAIRGDRTLFTKSEEIIAAWTFITPILDLWQTLPLHTYTKGSPGPEKTIIPITK